jgi:superoxide dismutase, Cu-Zn family
VAGSDAAPGGIAGPCTAGRSNGGAALLVKHLRWSPRSLIYPDEDCRLGLICAILLGMRATPLLIAALLCVPIAACGGGAGGASDRAAPPAPSAGNVEASGTFAAPPGAVVTYDEALVPVGATAAVDETVAGGSTTVTLDVAGLVPNRQYGAHAHVNPCGAAGKDAGPHFQLTRDPVTPSVDPAYANPQNEIWLDFTTNGQGAGRTTSTVAWEFPADRRAKSVIIHTMPTATEPGKAGTAGDRAACVTVAF